MEYVNIQKRTINSRHSATIGKTTDKALGIFINVNSLLYYSSFLVKNYSKSHSIDVY